MSVVSFAARRSHITSNYLKARMIMDMATQGEQNNATPYGGFIQAGHTSMTRQGMANGTQ
jgi:hypothetical protein